jgi:hypothetical protein
MGVGTGVSCSPQAERKKKQKTKNKDWEMMREEWVILLGGSENFNGEGAVVHFAEVGIGETGGEGVLPGVCA